MNKYILMASVAIIALGIVSESLATCPNGTRGSDDESNSDYCGVNCCWVITTVTNNDKTEKVLTITPALDSNNKPYTGVTMKNFSASWSTANKTNGYTSESSSNAPWARSDVTSVVVENGINNIGNNAFYGDTKITSVSGMENVATIGYQSFRDATSLQNIDMPKVTTIGNDAFGNASSLQSVDMPDVTSIGSNAFNGASSLQSVDMPKVTSIGGYAFWYARSLQSVDMPKVTSIGGYAFQGANSLQSVDMPNVTSIGNEAFKLATSLAYAGLNPNGSVSIGSDAFYGTNISNCTGTGANCGSCGNNYIMSGLGCVADCGAGYLGKEGRCIDAANGCGAGYKDMGGFCNRVRWTPAEVAKVLRDDDTNVVTITFKIQ